MTILARSGFVITCHHKFTLIALAELLYPRFTQVFQSFCLSKWFHPNRKSYQGPVAYRPHHHWSRFHQFYNKPSVHFYRISNHFTNTMVASISSNFSRFTSYPSVAHFCFSSLYISAVSSSNPFASNESNSILTSNQLTQGLVTFTVHLVAPILQSGPLPYLHHHLQVEHYVCIWTDSFYTRRLHLASTSPLPSNESIAVTTFIVYSPLKTATPFCDLRRG